ncbi:MAG: hypothetical protein IPM57_00320 [Oligoflexia bacterium]|nr:hypothetical protein [Oligoflexia bacterium]
MTTIPQAYTSRDMSEAYKWLQTLPPPLRDEFKTAEELVLSYLKAKRMGSLNNFQPEPTKKTAEFQKTLQNLKAEMDQFDFEPAPTTNVSNSASLQPQQTNQPNILSQIKIDPKSRQIINDIRDGLNLSSDMEVVRMSLVLAHKSLKNLIE